RETVRVIRQNIVVFAFGVNLVGVIVTGWLWPFLGTSEEWNRKAPLAGVIYHQLGSLLVLLNSMRLLAFERTSPASTVGRVRTAAKSVDAWLERFSLDEALHELAHRWRPIAATLLGVALLGWLSTCFAQVNAGEVGVARRFGRPSGDLKPGLHVCWPWPIETVTRIRPDEVRAVEVGFRSPDDAAVARIVGRDATGGGNTWTSGHGDGIARLSDEAQMLTGDDDLVEILATVRYHVADPRQFLFGVANAEALVRSNAESVLREVVAGRRFQELLTTRRAEVEAEALERLRRRLEVVAEGGAGVALDGFTLHDLHPPPGVVESYHKVAKSIQERDRTINEAEGDALRTVRRSQEESARVLRRAEADAHALTGAAKADRDAFLAWHAARNTLAPDEEAALAAERMKRLKAGEETGTVETDLAGRRAKLLAERRFLVENRLAVQAVVDVLRLRDKVLIDSGEAPGRRHLFLVDPDLLRMPSLVAPRVVEKDP
ncbi:MAG TPA: SPFH domain-containing protein, partial [Gemmata sp.]|nr:SPFH domain-containing protein [Gemmata sp.]